VALSVNKESIAARPLLRSLARQTFLSLSIVLLVSLLGLMPERAVSAHVTGFYLTIGVLVCFGFSGAANLRTLSENRRTGADTGRRLKEIEYIGRVIIYDTRHHLQH